MIYVSSTRVPLETVIDAFNAGFTPEEIVAQYDALSLSSVYQVIGYYLDHQADVDAYIARANEDREAVRRENEARPAVMALRAKLLDAKRKQGS